MYIKQCIIIIFLIMVTNYAEKSLHNYSRVKKVGELSLQNSEKLRLKTQHLDLTFKGKQTEIKATYTIINNDSTGKRCSFSVPIFIKDSLYDYSELLLEAGSIEKLLSGGYSIYNNETKEPPIIPYCSVVLNDFSVAVFPKLNTSEELISLEGNLYFPVGSSELTLSYAVTNSFVDSSHKNTLLPHFGPRSITYDFHQKEKWSEGSVDSLTLKVAVREEAALFLSEAYKLPAMLKKKFDFLGNPYRVMHYSLEQVAYENLSPLYLESDISPLLLTEEIKKRRISLPSDAVQIKASKVSSADSIMHLIDGDPTTGWIANNSGKRWIELSFDSTTVANDITGIFLLNGDWKSERTYLNNRRIKAATVEVSGLTTEAEPVRDSYSIQYNRQDSLYFDNTLYGQRCVQLYSTSGRTPQSVNRFRLTIDDFIRGKKNSKIVISEIIVTGK